MQSSRSRLSIRIRSAIKQIHLRFEANSGVCTGIAAVVASAAEAASKWHSHAVYRWNTNSNYFLAIAVLCSLRIFSVKLHGHSKAALNSNSKAGNAFPSVSAELYGLLPAMGALLPPEIMTKGISLVMNKFVRRFRWRRIDSVEDISGPGLGSDGSNEQTKSDTRSAGGSGEKDTRVIGLHALAIFHSKSFTRTVCSLAQLPTIETISPRCVWRAYRYDLNAFPLRECNALWAASLRAPLHLQRPR